MSEVKRYTAYDALMQTESNGKYVLASDYDKLAKELVRLKGCIKILDNCNECGEVYLERDKLAADRTKCWEEFKVASRMLDRARDERDSAEAELAELKAKMGGMVNSLLEAGNPLSNAAYNLAHKAGQPLTQEHCALLSVLQKRWDEARSMLAAAPQRPAIVAALQAECKGLEDEVNKLERNLAAAPSKGQQ